MIKLHPGSKVLYAGHVDKGSFTGMREVSIVSGPAPLRSPCPHCGSSGFFYRVKGVPSSDYSCACLLWPMMDSEAIRRIDDGS